MSWLTSCILFFERFWKIFGINNYWFWFEGRGCKKRKFLFTFIIRVKRACPNFRIILILWSLDKRHIFAFFAEFTKFFKQTKNFLLHRVEKKKWNMTFVLILRSINFPPILLQRVFNLHGLIFVQKISIKLPYHASSS